MLRYGSIYKITNEVNGKIYIGQTTSTVQNRWTQHVCLARTGNSAINRAIAKYGASSFTIEEIAVAFDREALDQIETKLIMEHNALVPAGYNLQHGGHSKKHHEATRRQMSESQKKRNQDPVERAKHGHKYTEEEKRRRSEQYKALGIKVKHTPKSIAKMAASKRGKPGTKARPIVDQNGIVYRSMTEAANKTGCGISDISNVVNGRYKQIKGYVFKYLNQAA